MKKMLFLYPCMFLYFCTLISCRKEFDDHYKTEGESTISESIVEILRVDPEFSLFVEAIDRLDLATILGESAIYTCLAPTNKNVEAYLVSIGCSSIKDVPESELTMWLNYHWIYGMYYRYDIEKKGSDIVDTETPIFFKSNADYKTREDSKHPGKQIRLYTPSWLTPRASDYRFLKNEDIDPTSFSAEGIIFSDRYDINAANGVIHVLTEPLNRLPRADEAIAQDPSLSIVKNWIERYVAYEIKGVDEDGKMDTTKVKHYTFGADIAVERNRYTFIAPTNESIEEYFAPYLEENFSGEYDSIPAKLVQAILQTSFMHGYFGMSDITRGDRPPYYALGLQNTYFRLANDVEPYYVGGISASNTMIYKVSKMIEPAILNSVEGGIYMNQSKYKEWNKILGKGKVSGLTSLLLYEHPVRTILIQPDNIWTIFVEDYEPEDLDTLAWSLNAGIILDNIKDGEFKEKTYYNTTYGSIFYENNTFTDYTDNSVNLTSKESTWEGANGAIYEIDGFLEPLIVSDTNQTAYKMLVADTNYTLFKIACDITGVSEILLQTGYFQYTILAPTNQAFIDAGIDDLLMPEDELKELLERHIIQRKIFTDGAYSGNIVNISGDVLVINGKWEGFTVTDATGEVHYVDLENSNKQANNGVIHRVNKLLNKKQ